MYALIAALIAVSLAMSVSAIREPIINFFVEIYDSFISIFVDAPAPASIAIEEKYELGYLPEGFELVEEKEWNSSNEKIYSDGNKQIKFVQLSYSSELGVEIALDNNESNAKYIDISGNSIVYTQKNNSTTLVWIKDEYVFKLVFNFEITEDEWIRIVEFISKK